MQNDLNFYRFSLNCPLPELDMDTIVLGHGSGGLLTNQLLDKGVFDLFKNADLQQRHDGVLLPTNGQVAFTTDSFVVSPIFFPGGNIGDLAVNGTVNDLAMCGARPKYLSLAFILEEGLAMKDFWEILLTIRNAAERAGVQIVTGDTKVVDRGKGDKIFINTTGIGERIDGADIDHRRITPGDKIIVSHGIAHHGMAIMLEREGLKFEAPIQSDSRPVHVPVQRLLEELGGQVKLLRDPTRGGVATVLNEIASQCSLGVDLVEKSIPVDPVVASACEVLGLDPLYVANEGVFIAVVEDGAESRALEILRSFEECRQAEVIGMFTEDHPRKVLMSSGIGGRRVVNMLAGEQLPRIC
ncbi:MAG: hydrogenase expression/formation protein HypE [Bacteroidota bacterium]|nr:hydrogenase expression/formation protein HypE [Bacteroidota bacterium]